MEPNRGGPAVRIRRGTVLRIAGERRGAVVVSVLLRPEELVVDALAYPGLVGPVAEGDEVVLNTTASALGLGTGGFDLVMAVVGGPDTELQHPGRTMKLRYTPAQAAVESVEERHREALEASPGLRGTPVVAAPLHSMIAHAAAGAKAAGAERVVYVMTDGAALLGGFSELVPRLRAAGVLDGFVTCGQALGGELEAATLWTGLLAAKEVLGADAIVVADGPGNLGTGTRWGVSALASGHALNAAEALGGRAVAALRVSFADPRERHRGVSHHSLTILGHVALVRANVAVPVLEGAEREAVWAALRGAKLEERHQLIEVDGRPALDRLARAGVVVQSMGRTAADDPAFFLAAGAAGVLAGRMAAGDRRWRA